METERKEFKTIKDYQHAFSVLAKKCMEHFDANDITVHVIHGKTQIEFG